MKKSQSIQEFVSSLIDGNLLQEEQSLLMSDIGGKNDSIPKKKKNTGKPLLDLTVEKTNFKRKDCADSNGRCINVGLSVCSGENHDCKNGRSEHEINSFTF